MKKGDSEIGGKEIRFALSDESIEVLDTFQCVYSHSKRQDALNQLILKYSDLDDNVNKVLRIRRAVKNV